MITLLDYGAGNVRSVINAVEKLGERVKIAACGEDILQAEKLLFPRGGCFRQYDAYPQSKRVLRAVAGLSQLKSAVSGDLPWDAGLV
jgi:imidazoleglycerol phosphate synthase glutamine amidotransferase subunit HisH